MSESLKILTILCLQCFKDAIVMKNGKKSPEENQNRAKKYSYNKIAIMTEFSQTLIKTLHIVLCIVD